MVVSASYSARPRAAKVIAGPRLPPLKYEDALDLPAELLADLPLPPRITLHVAGVPGLVTIELDTSRDAGEGVAIDPEEWRALVHGACADRVWPLDFSAFCQRKVDEPAWRIEEETALAGAQRDPDEVWSARRVLDRLGAHVISIEIY